MKRNLCSDWLDDKYAPGSQLCKMDLSLLRAIWSHQIPYYDNKLVYLKFNCKVLTTVFPYSVNVNWIKYTGNIPLSGLGLLCDLVNMAASLQDEDLFFDKLEGGPSNSTLESSSSEDLPEDASRLSAFDLFSFTKRIDANFREGFAWVTKIYKQINKIRRGHIISILTL